MFQMYKNSSFTLKYLSLYLAVSSYFRRNLQIFSLSVEPITIVFRIERLNTFQIFLIINSSDNGIKIDNYLAFSIFGI